MTIEKLNADISLLQKELLNIRFERCSVEDKAEMLVRFSRNVGGLINCMCSKANEEELSDGHVLVKASQAIEEADESELTDGATEEELESNLEPIKKMRKPKANKDETE